jgi:hypothetical protein
MGFLSIIMAWSVDTIYGFLRFLLRKNQSGSVSSTEFFYAWNSEQSAYFLDLKGRFQARNNGKEGINTGLIENETIETKLSPFTKTDTITIVSGNGNKPSDFSYLLAFRINGFPVFHINKNQIATVIDSVIDPPSMADNCYYYTPYQGYYSFLPSAVTQATIDYIANPVDVLWAYTIVGGRQVYNAGGSTQPQWPQEDIIEITKRTLKSFGVSYKDNDFTQFGNSIINTGD